MAANRFRRPHFRSHVCDRRADICQSVVDWLSSHNRLQGFLHHGLHVPAKELTRLAQEVRRGDYPARRSLHDRPVESLERLLQLVDRFGGHLLVVELFLFVLGPPEIC